VQARSEVSEVARPAAEKFLEEKLKNIIGFSAEVHSIANGPWRWSTGDAVNVFDLQRAL